MKYMGHILRYINDNDFTHRDDVAIIISDVFDDNPYIEKDEFIKKIKDIKRDFFRINKINREDFAIGLYDILTDIKKERKDNILNFNIVKDYLSKYLLIGFNDKEHIDERDKIIKRFSTIKKPHEKVMKSFNILLSGIDKSYSIVIHGVKEYSGIDIVNNINNEVKVGFQIKTRSDDISEHMIRSQSSKAQDWELDGFVLVFARKGNKKVDVSIQAAYHHFLMVNRNKKMFCAIIYPELLAELFRIYDVSV